jgi:hypothetical protein
MNGLSMLLENSNKVIRHAVQNLEEGVLKRRIHDQFVINMTYSPDEDIKGDIDVIAKGSSSLIERAAIRQRRVELLSAISNIPEAQMPGIATVMSKIKLAILSDTAKDLDIQAEKFPTEEEIEKAIAQFQESQKQQPPQKDPRVEAAEIAYKSRIEDQQLEMKDRQLQRDHQLKVEQLRLAGTQQSMERAGQRTFDQEKMKMAERLMKTQEESKRFQQEMDIKKQQGTGI